MTEETVIKPEKLKDYFTGKEPVPRSVWLSIIVTLIGVGLVLGGIIVPAALARAVPLYAGNYKLTVKVKVAYSGMAWENLDFMVYDGDGGFQESGTTDTEDREYEVEDVSSDGTGVCLIQMTHTSKYALWSEANSTGATPIGWIEDENLNKWLFQFNITESIVVIRLTVADLGNLSSISTPTVNLSTDARGSFTTYHQMELATSSMMDFSGSINMTYNEDRIYLDSIDVRYWTADEAATAWQSLAITHHDKSDDDNDIDKASWENDNWDDGDTWEITWESIQNENKDDNKIIQFKLDFSYNVNVSKSVTVQSRYYYIPPQHEESLYMTTNQTLNFA